jgi:hypothetical protein
MHICFRWAEMEERGRLENIRVDIKERGVETVDWIYLIHDENSVAGCCESGNEQWGSSCSRS